MTETIPTATHFARPALFELSLPYGDYRFSQRLYEVVHDWGIPTETEIDFLRKYLPSSGGKALDLACGAGRHSVGLTLFGHNLTGIDIGGFTIDLARNFAREKGVTVDFRTGDIRKIEFRDEFDLVFFICGQMAHLSPKENESLFRKVHTALKPNGAFVIHLEKLEPEDRLNRTFWYRELKPLYFSNPSLVHREQYFFPRENAKLIRDFAIDSETKESGLFGYSEKEYTREEMNYLASRTGFAVSEQFGSYDRASAQTESENRIFILRINPGSNSLS